MFHRIMRYAVVVVLLVCTQQLLACETQAYGFSASSRSGAGELNDYGAIVMDANNSSCAKLAHDALVTKLKTTPDSFFQQSLAGYYVALAFAAAVRLGSYGWFNTATDPVYTTDTLAGQLDRVIGLYQVVSHAGGCGTGYLGNSCMDDHAGAAAAYAWMSAYKKKRLDGDTWWYAYTSGQYIASFFNNVCIYKSSTFNGTAVCNGTVDDLRNGTAEAFPFEHGFESPHYGFGLVTSIVQAIVGLEAAGAAYNLSDDEKVKARALMANMQSHTDSSTLNFKSNDCRDPELVNGSWVINTGHACEDFGDGGYNPKMYHLAEFFAAPNGNGTGGHVGDPPSGTYQSNTEYGSWDLSNFNSAFGYGRYATYHEQGYTWYVDRITNGSNLYANNPRYMPFDNNAAQGYLDTVNDDGWAYGWACDADAPNSFVKVDLYANGVKIPDAADQYATSDSIQPEINSLCGGGTAHRWYSQVPSSYIGQTITAKARDYTFRPSVTLPCVTECVR